MPDTTFEIRVSAALLQFGVDRDELQERANEWLVISLFSDGHVSSGKAAQLLGISRMAFLDLLHRRGVAYINYTPEELEEEFAAVEHLKNMSSS